MSVTLITRVLESALESDLKPIAVVFAYHAHDDGSSLYPSIGRVAWLLGRTGRSISSAVVRLRHLGILVPLAPLTTVNGHLQPRGGRGRSTDYRFVVEALPARLPWEYERAVQAAKQCGKLHPLDITKGGSLRTERVKSARKRVKFAQERVPQTSSQPSEEPSVEPSGKKLPAALRPDEIWNRVLAQLQDALPKHNFLTWVDGARGVALQGPRLVVMAESVKASWVERHYAAELRAALDSVNTELVVQWVEPQAQVAALG